MNQPSSSSSINYRQTIFTLITALKKLQYFAQTLNLINLVEPLNELLNRIERNSFSIAVFGNFNCGKSTFINALIGQKILPSDILATTATQSRITYRLTPGAKICFKDGSEQQIAIEQLTDYVTKLTSESESTAAKLKEAVIYYPVPYCQNNLEIIDTPGLNDDGEMTAVTSESIHKCDLAIMVISAISPFSISEGKFLITKLFANNINHVLFVVNQIDLLNSYEDAERVINLIANRISSCILEWAKQHPNPQEYLIKIGKNKVHGLSAFQALQAKQTNNIPLLAESRFVNFEYKFKTLINQERELIQLQLTSNRIIIYATEIIQTVIAQKCELEQKQASLTKASQTIKNEIATLRRKKTDNIQLINTTLASTKKQAQASYYRLENELKVAAEQVIQLTNINATDLSELAVLVLNAVQSATKDLAKKIQTEMQQALNAGLVKLKDLAEVFDSVIPRVNQEMSQLGLNTTICSKMMGILGSVHRVCDTFSRQQPPLLSLSFPSNSEMFNFVNNPSGRNTIEAVFGFILTADYPMGETIKGAIGAAVGNNMKANKFKENYQLQVMAEIEKQVKLMKVNQTVNDYISKAVSQIEELQTLFLKGVNSLLDTIQNHLAEFSGKHEATIVAKQRELSQIQTEVQAIMGRTQKLSEQLRELAA